MAKANVKLYFEGNLLTQTTVKSNLPKVFEESLIDKWTDMFRVNSITLKSLKVNKWDVIEFEVDGVIYTRNYEVPENET